jgi:hypothetical protein
MRWQVEHSNVRISKSRLPGDICASPILCLQVGQDGRSVIRITAPMNTNLNGTPSGPPLDALVKMIK